jgi:Ran GTPase-activating protein (RanGAP) involved in mRNA processing and transport
MARSTDDSKPKEALAPLLQASSPTTPLIVCVPTAADVGPTVGALMQLAMDTPAGCLIMDLKVGRAHPVTEQLEQEARRGDWVVLVHTQGAAPEVLRHIARSLAAIPAPELSPTFRLWIPHVGDLDPTAPSPYPAPLLLPALFLLTDGSIGPYGSFTTEQVTDLLDEATSTEILVLEELLYSNDPTAAVVTLNHSHQPHLLEVLEAVKFCTTCHTLGVEDCALTAVEVAYVAHTVTANPRIQQLSLVQCGLSGDSVSELCHRLHRHTTLTALDLSRNPSLGDSGIRLLADLLDPTSGCPLRRLDLRMSRPLLRSDPRGFRHPSFVRLCRSLKTNTHLTALNLFSLGLDPRAGRSLARGLLSNRSLSTLDIAANPIGDDGAVAMAKALRVNTTLTHLDVSFCELSVIALCAFARSLGSLGCLVLSGNRVTQLPEPQALSNGVFDADEEGDGSDRHPSSGSEDDAAVAPAFRRRSTANDVAPVNGIEYAFSETDSAFGDSVLLPVKAVEDRYGRLEGFQALADALNTNTTLHTLRLTSCGLPESALALLASALLRGPNTTLTALTLGRNDAFDKPAGFQVQDLLIGRPALTDLCLSNSTRVVAEWALRGLRKNTGLRLLDLSYCSVDHELASSLHEALSVNTRCALTALNLAGNPLGAAGWAHLSRTLALPHLRLETLDVGSTVHLSDLPHDGGIATLSAFGLAVAVAPHLRELSLRNNGLTDTLAATLAATAAPSTTLRKLDLSDNLLTQIPEDLRTLFPPTVVLVADRQQRPVPS